MKAAIRKGHALPARAVACSAALLAACSPAAQDATRASPAQPRAAVSPAAQVPPGVSRFDDPATERAVRQLEALARPVAACQQAMDAVERGRADPGEALEALCRTALADAGDADAARLSARYRGLVRSSFAAELWAVAALGGDGAAWLGLARHLDAEAGPAGADNAALDAASLAGAQAAAQRAVNLGVPEAADELARLQDREFPLAGARLEPLWRAIYFRQFDRIADTIDNRRHVAGFTLGVVDICSRWEVGVRTVGFDAALETYLAPVRGQVPGRVVQALPKVGRTLAESAAEARDGMAGRGLDGVIEQGLRIYHAARREVRNAVAVGSSDGRHAGQQLFNSVQSCRSPRGMKMLDALGDYFRFMHNRSPLRPQAQPPAPPSQPSPGTVAHRQE